MEYKIVWDADYKDAEIQVIEKNNIVKTLSISDEELVKQLPLYIEQDLKDRSIEKATFTPFYMLKCKDSCLEIEQKQFSFTRKVTVYMYTTIPKEVLNQNIKQWFENSKEIEPKFHEL